jgi:hypothetical protein
MGVQIPPEIPMNKYYFAILVIVATIALFLALSSGCSKKLDSSPPRIDTAIKLTDLEVVANMRSNNVVPWDGYAIADLAYELPSEEWVTDKLPNILWNFIHDLKQTKYIEESNDCDDFAKMAAAFTHLLHSNTPNREKNTGLAFGEFYYKINGDPKLGHAINFSLVKSKGGFIKLLFFDPQTFKIVNLNQKELESCQNWLL